MFRKSKIKIVCYIMTILTVLWIGTIGVIYGSSYYEMNKENEKHLQNHAKKYTISQDKADEVSPKDPPKAPKPKPHRFYTVSLSYSGEVIQTDNDGSTVYTTETLESMAKRIVLESKNFGTKTNLTYLLVDKGEYILVTFMDNTNINEGARTLIRYTMIYGCIALIPFFLVSISIAKRIVDPLEESYKKQKQFISDAGHELKTPVSIVSANAELLSRELGENQWLRNIQYENERMGILVAQLLELARTENVTPQMEILDFSRLVAGETLPFESVAFEKGLVLNTDITDGIMAEGNSAQMKQLVSILLDNAIRHGKEKTEVTLTLTKEPGMAKLSVINSGDEIPEAQRKQLFERFYRVDTARNGDEKHYGLGLAIAKAIVNTHRGHLEVLCYQGLVEFRAGLPTAR